MAHSRQEARERKERWRDRDLRRWQEVAELGILAAVIIVTDVFGSGVQDVAITSGPLLVLLGVRRGRG